MSITESTKPADALPVDATPVAANYYDKDVAFAAPAPQVVIVQPTVVMQAAPVDANGLVVGRWKADICGCFTDLVPNCCMACWCPCVSLAQTVHRVGLYTYANALLVLVIIFGASYVTTGLSSFFRDTSCTYYSGGLTVCATTMSFWGYISSVCEIVSIAIIMLARMKIRGMFQIPGNACEDCLCAFFCSCCSVAQMATQTDSYTPNDCNFGPKETLRGYVLV
ncbi:hypothetical protein SPRG_15576 [Saprolegnia parasitica CBS 223.65]|uniref:PLAC8 family protein n=1 Tax=Saprolegnia parasitica (strain CBS 223.65) TaxID=695850 RepID=A0A067BWX8_SAPPC|nr:hypothetical protein SPRG_15576 [Saprolegnia parasitica CBS 223.65]KDO19097.1 hypothetical protein SPRG_15576 [Saprolegnia parasitica CBS 223.65]|eukprot:XP_012210200.1 hypothetical protein SPRG_15576 [Saprolegnia parasitica CBS 223.65]